MKVVMVTPWISRLGGGVTEAMRLQALALADEAELTVLAFEDRASPGDAEVWSSIDVQTFSAFGPRRYRISPGMLIALFRLRPDLVHVHGVWQFHCLAVWIWSLITGRPYVVTPHGMLDPWIRGRSWWIKAVVTALYQRRFLKRAAGFQVLTDVEGQHLVERRPDQAMAVVPNAVPPFIAPLIKPVWWRRDLAGRDVYLFLGRLHEKKGCLELCAAWEQLCLADAGFAGRSALIFCGWNDGLIGLEEAVRGLDGAYGNVLLAGPQYGEDKTASLASASFFVLPSKSEGMPMTVLEAWSAGVPVIMTDGCNLPIGFTSGAAMRCGENAGSIADALARASRLSEEERSVMAHNGRRLVAEQFSNETVRAGLPELYRQALTRRVGECRQGWIKGRVSP